jgi:acetyl-CoA carboxylase biotin carboxyl carrier protein
MDEVKKIKELIEIMDDNNLSEISIKNGEEAISLKRGGQVQQVINSVPANIPVEQKKDSEPEEDSNLIKIKSPMVGTFYSSPSPEAEAYAQEGQEIKVDSVLCIIEAMKVMNEVKSEVSGKIVKILVENAEAIEFDQVLFLVEKK